MKIGLFNGFTIRKGTDGLTEDNLVRLWHSVGWISGSSQIPNRLLASMKNAGTVITGWKDEKLIGLCSALDDGLNVWISYMLVDGAYQNSGIGGFLIDQMIQNYSNHRIYVQSMHAADFYKKHGFKETMTSLKLDNVNYRKG